jgi:hypothetical protein
MNSQWANLGSVWLVISPDDRLFEVVTDLQKARRTAKNINGYMVELDIFEDYRRLTPERELTPNTPRKLCDCGALEHGWHNHRSWCAHAAWRKQSELRRIGTVGAE